jgi:hypothetical protein
MGTLQLTPVTPWCDCLSCVDPPAFDALAIRPSYLRIPSLLIISR